MTAVVDIYNMALMQVGISQTVVTVGDTSQEALACTAFYQISRDMVLRAFPWPFAKTRAALVATLNTPPLNWQYQYTVPTGCLRMLNMTVPGAPTPRNDQRIPYEVATDGTVTVINCNQIAAELVYTRQVTDTTQWPPDAIMALAFLLGSKIAMPLSVSPKMAQSAYQGYVQMVREAAATAMSEGQEGPQPDSDLVAIRNTNYIQGYGSYPYSLYPSGYTIG